MQFYVKPACRRLLRFPSKGSLVTTPEMQIIQYERIKRNHLTNGSYVYNKIMPAPAIPATTR